MLAASSATGTAAAPSSCASCSSFDTSRPASATRTPLATSARAMPAPRSPYAPATMAVRPAISKNPVESSDIERTFLPSKPARTERDHRNEQQVHREQRPFRRVGARKPDDEADQ